MGPERETRRSPPGARPASPPSAAGTPAPRNARSARPREAEEVAARLDYAAARSAHAAGHVGDAELACIYVAERVHRAAGARWLQAERRPPLRSGAASPWVRLFAERELCRVPSPVPRALLAWAEGERPVDLSFSIPTPRDLLRLQARGRRCVSLLDDGAPTAPHADGLAFALHDLCHLEKLCDPAHRAGQVGFFARLDRALDDPRWHTLEATLDAEWIDGRDHVLADMNGSAVFLFLVLKNKLKLAVRRRLAAARGEPPRAPLRRSEPDPRDEAACDEAYEILYAALGLEGAALASARAMASRTVGVEGAADLLAFFESAGAGARPVIASRGP